MTTAMIKAKNARILPAGFFISLFQELVIANGAMIYLKFNGGYTVLSHLRGRLGHTQRYVVAANHSSYLDPFMIVSALGWRNRLKLMPFKVMILPKAYHKWYVKPFAYLSGGYPAHIRERKHHTYGIEGSIKLLDYGYNICIFPEGKLTTREDSDPKSGIVRILEARPDAKLLLVHLEWPHKRSWKGPVKITIAPAPEGLDRSDPKAIMDAIYELQ